MSSQHRFSKNRKLFIRNISLVISGGLILPKYLLSHTDRYLNTNRNSITGGKAFCYTEKISFPSCTLNTQEEKQVPAAELLLAALYHLGECKLTTIECCISGTGGEKHLILSFDNHKEIHWLEGLLPSSLKRLESKKQLRRMQPIFHDITVLTEYTDLTSDQYLIRKKLHPEADTCIIAGTQAINRFNLVKRSQQCKFKYPEHYVSFKWDSQLQNIII